MDYQELIQIQKNWKGKVCIFGAGDTGKTWTYDLLTSAGFTIDVYGDNFKKAGQEIQDGIKTISLETLYSYKDNVLVFIAVDDPLLQQSIKDQLIENGISNIVIMGYFSVQQCIEDLMDINDFKLNEQFRCLLDDEEYICKKFKRLLGCYPDLKHPQTFNEKLQWLKLHDRNPEYTKLVDKYEVKKYIANKISPEYIIPTLGVYKTFDEINFNKLPNQFAIKCTHDSGGVVVCKDKTLFDKMGAKSKLNTSLNRNFYLLSREWPYKNVPRKIIIEKYLEDESGKELKDYKIFCFHGEPKLIQVDFGRFDVHKRNLYTTDWKYVNASIEYPKDPKTQIPRPEKLDKMLEIASQLSEGIPHIRVDLYSIKDKIYFGELTMCHGGGYEKFMPEELGIQMGNWLALPL